MEIKIFEDRSYSKDYLHNEGTEFENKATTLHFTIPETLEGIETSSLNKYIVFDIEGNQNRDILTPENTYVLPSFITKLGSVKFNLYLIEPSTGAQNENLFVWVSKQISLNFNDAVQKKDVIISQEEIDIFNSLMTELNETIAEVNLLEADFQAAITQVENLDIDVSKTGTTATVTITNKEGIEKSVNIEDGQKGDKGDTGDKGDKGDDYVITQEDYQEIADIVEEQIEIPTKLSDLDNDEGFIDNTVNDLENYTLTQDLAEVATSGSYNDLSNTPTIPTKTSDLTNDSGFIDKNVNNLTNYYKTSETYNKTEVDNKISSVYKYKGTVATYADLPSTDLTVGDVYNVESTGDNYAWTGTTWDKLGGDIDLSEYYTKTQTDNLLEGKADTEDIPDLTDYVKNTDYAGNDNNVAGLIKVYNAYGIKIDSNGSLQARELTNEQYNSATNFALLGKGTLENVITGKQLINQTQLDTKQDKITSENAGNKIEIENSLLSSEYQQVEYIESSGGQYIDTGVKGNNNTRADISFRTKTVGNSQAVFGYYVGGYNKTLFLYSSGDKHFQVGYGAFQNLSDRWVDNTKYEISLSNGKIIINGTEMTITEASDFTTDENLILFKISGSTGGGMPIQLYNFKIYNGDTLVRNFIPCYKISNNEIGLYDIVNNVFYTNAGTGTFTKGENINSNLKISVSQDFIDNYNKLKADHPPIEEEGTDLSLQGTGEFDLALSPKGNITQETRKGYNLLPSVNTTRTINGITYTKNNDGSITANGTATDVSMYPISIDSETLVSNVTINPGTYIVTDNVGDYTNYFTQVSDNSTFWANTGVAGTVGVTPSFTLDSTKNLSAKLYIRSGVTMNNVTFKPMIISGTTVKPYEPYGASPSPSYPSPVKVVDGEYEVEVENKNLVDVSKMQLGTISQTDGTTISSSGDVKYSDYINVKPNETYALSFGGGTPTIRIFKYDKNKNYLGTSAGTISTITIDSNTYYIRLQGNKSFIDNNFQLELGSTATPYKPHSDQTQTIDTSPNPLYSEDDLYFKAVNGDKFYDSLTSEQKANLESGSWYVHNEYYKYNFTGQENFSRSANSGNPLPLFYVFLSNIPLAHSSTSTTIFSNRYKGDTTANLLTNDYPTINASGGNSNNQFNISSNYASKEEFKAYLQNNSTYMIYKMETPINTKITNTTLITQLEALQNIKAYQDQTNISQTHNSAQADMKINAKTIMSMRYMQKEIENLSSRLALLE